MYPRPRLSTLVEVPVGTRVVSVEPEIYSKGHIYAAEDVARRQVLVLAQCMRHVKTTIEDTSASASRSRPCSSPATCSCGRAAPGRSG